jgi:hypothetical protein
MGRSAATRSRSAATAAGGSVACSAAAAPVASGDSRVSWASSVRPGVPDQASACQRSRRSLPGSPGRSRSARTTSSLLASATSASTRARRTGDSRPAWCSRQTRSTTAPRTAGAAGRPALAAANTPAYQPSASWSPAAMARTARVTAPSCCPVSSPMAKSSTSAQAGWSQAFSMCGSGAAPRPVSFLATRYCWTLRWIHSTGPSPSACSSPPAWTRMPICRTGSQVWLRPGGAAGP